MTLCPPVRSTGRADLRKQRIRCLARCSTTHTSILQICLAQCRAPHLLHPCRSMPSRLFSPHDDGAAWRLARQLAQRGDLDTSPPALTTATDPPPGSSPGNSPTSMPNDTDDHHSGARGAGRVREWRSLNVRRAASVRAGLSEVQDRRAMGGTHTNRPVVDAVGQARREHVGRAGRCRRRRSGCRQKTFRRDGESGLVPDNVTATPARTRRQQARGPALTEGCPVARSGPGRRARSAGRSDRRRARSRRRR
jgi:hypothetical protein